MWSNSGLGESNIQEYVKSEKKYIDKVMISMIWKYPFIYDQSLPVEGDRKKIIEETFDYIASKISETALYHELIGM